MDVYKPPFNFPLCIAARLFISFHICLSSSFDSVLSNFLYFILHCILKQSTNYKTQFFFDTRCIYLETSIENKTSTITP